MTIHRAMQLTPARAAYAATVLLLLAPVRVAAQRPVTRQEAVAAALSSGAGMAVAQATLAAARARTRAARAYPNPALSASYSKDAPQYHASVDVPIDYP
jgi:outer membrane protein TolC